MGPMLGDSKRGRLRKVMDLTGRGPDGHPGVQGRATARAGGGIMVRDAIGMFRTAQRAAGVAPLPTRLAVAGPMARPPALPQHLRRRFGQPITRRRFATVGTVKPEAALQLRDARGLDSDRGAKLGNHGITVREGRRQSRDPVSQCLKIVNHHS